MSHKLLSLKEIYLPKNLFNISKESFDYDNNYLRLLGQRREILKKISQQYYIEETG